jgi:DoxX-like family
VQTAGPRAEPGPGDGRRATIWCAFWRSFFENAGVVEVVLALWVLSRLAPVFCALAQTVLLVALNTCGLLFARELIHDPPGMVVKNFAFLVLVWVSASSTAWQ